MAQVQSVTVIFSVLIQETHQLKLITTPVQELVTTTFQVQVIFDCSSFVLSLVIISFHFETFNKSQLSATSPIQAFVLFIVKRLTKNIIKNFFSIFFC